jgi:hypothetical protein
MNHNSVATIVVQAGPVVVSVVGASAAAVNVAAVVVAGAAGLAVIAVGYGAYRALAAIRPPCRASSDRSPALSR